MGPSSNGLATEVRPHSLRFSVSEQVQLAASDVRDARSTGESSRSPRFVVTWTEARATGTGASVLRSKSFEPAFHPTTPRPAPTPEKEFAVRDVSNAST